MSQRKSASFFQVYMELNLYLREIIFVTNVAVLKTIKLVFKPLDMFWRFSNTRKRCVCVKGNIEGRERGWLDKVCFEVQKTSDNTGGKLTRGFLLQHKNI